MAFMATQQAINVETFVAEVTSLKFWVLGDAAVMRADHAMPGNRRPPYSRHPAMGEAQRTLADGGEPADDNPSSDDLSDCYSPSDLVS